MYPVLNQCTIMVVTLIYADDKTYFLDASEPILVLVLPLSCQQRACKVMNAAAEFFYADSVKETKKLRYLLQMMKRKPGRQVTTNPGYYESWNQESYWKGKDALLKDIQKELGSDYTV